MIGRMEGMLTVLIVRRARFVNAIEASLAIALVMSNQLSLESGNFDG